MKHSILAAMLILMASNAMAFGSPGSVVVDIVGSDVKDTVVVADGRGGIDLEIIGSTAKNTTVSPYMSLAICQSCQICPACPTCPMPIYPTPVCPTCPTCPPDEGAYKPPTPWDYMHLGVDAWYGAFWYRDYPNMPKWPQI
ncbi:hypothetical protein [Methanothrix sp.]|uniref:hypothetical protein n=1 Tax=Methanothrix sp. TaxID=90426 RepID=UPI001BD3D47F